MLLLRLALRRARVPLSSRSLSSLSHVCPSCSKPLPSTVPACTSCWSISPIPPQTTHHQLFELPEEPNPFRIDVATLKQRFRQGQAACHPDTWATKDPNTRELAHGLSSRLNEAFNCLSKPLARAEYILSQHGQPLEDEDRVDIKDVEFISDIMEDLETIEEASAPDREVVEALLERYHGKVEGEVSEVSRAIEGKEWQRGKESAMRLRYLERVRGQAETWLDNH